jgi:dihydroorotate dehydrogenase
MPDWSYRTVLRPILFRLPPASARDLALRVMGPLGRNAAGRALIDFLGHMRAPSVLRHSLKGLSFPSRVGLGCGLDPGLRAFEGFARFGVGFVEVGPIALAPRRGGFVGLDGAQASLVLGTPGDTVGLAAAVERLSGTRPAGVPLIARIEADDEDACGRLIDGLGPHVDAFALDGGRETWSDAEWVRFYGQAHAAARQASRPLLACVPAGLDASALRRRAQAAERIDGFVVEGALRTGVDRKQLGAPARSAALETVRLLRAQAPDAAIVAGGGVHDPQDALGLLDAGADLVSIESGLVFSGPGLPKRVNDAVRSARTSATEPTDRAATMSWFWTLLMGLGMLFGSVLALAIAATRVVLPYDEQFVGLSRAELHAINERLLPFMAHDRVTLAGTMITIGVLYSSLSWFAVRRGQHWAQVAVLSSAAAGFASFFLFLGFGYFDPFHAFVTAVLFQFLLMGIHGRLAEPHGLPPPMLVEDRAWRLSQWGQLGLIAQAVGFTAAGVFISFIGATHVFVREDLEFMRTTADAIVAAGPRLVPLVAHDRASFGGMLFVCGLVFLMTSLWGFRRGERWLWWTLLAAGLAGYGAAIGVHYAVGYHSPFHLAPAFAGLALFTGSMALSYPYLTATSGEAAAPGTRSRRAEPLADPAGSLRP